jgi:hypothetical protein
MQLLLSVLILLGVLAAAPVHIVNGYKTNIPEH